MAKVLDGVRVVDLTHVMAGPFCTYRLALLGADVVKIEPRAGDVFREYRAQDPVLGGDSAVFVGVNAGKRSVALNLKDDGARRALDALVDRADVVVENFRPGVAERLGVDAATVRARNPRLIHCSMSGYGQYGPMRDWPAYDHILQAVSGLMTLAGEEDAPPMKAGFPVVDTFAGYAAATAIITALLHRERTGRGDTIDVSMLDNALVLMTSMVLPYLAIGQQPRRVGNRGYNLSPTSDTFATGDGALAIGANTKAQFEALCTVVGRADLIDHPLFATREQRVENSGRLRIELEDALGARPAVEWELRLSDAGVPAGAVRTVPEACDLPQVRKRQVTHTVRARTGNPVAALGLGVEYDELDWGTERPAPALGEHTAEVLDELGYSSDEIADMRDRGAAFTADDDHESSRW